MKIGIEFTDPEADEQIERLEKFAGDDAVQRQAIAAVVVEGIADFEQKASEVRLVDKWDNQITFDREKHSATGYIFPAVTFGSEGSE